MYNFTKFFFNLNNWFLLLVDQMLIRNVNN